MRGVALAVAAVLALPAAARPQDTGAIAIDGVEVAPARQPARITPRGLDLGTYARPFEEPLRPSAADRSLPHFEATVEVEAPLPPDFNATMAVWWRHFDFEYSIYGHGYNLQDNPNPASVNILPLIDWAAKQVRNYRRNRSSPEAPSE